MALINPMNMSPASDKYMVGMHECPCGVATSYNVVKGGNVGIDCYCGRRIIIACGSFRDDKPFVAKIFPSLHTQQFDPEQNNKQETNKMDMNLNTLRTLQEGIQVMQVLYINGAQHLIVGEDGSITDTVSPMHGTQRYHFLCHESDNVMANDIVVVRNKSGGVGIAFVEKVMSIDEVDLDVSWSYTWFVCKADFSTYEVRVKADKEAMKTVRKVQVSAFARQMRDDLTERLGLKGAGQIIDALSLTTEDDK